MGHGGDAGDLSAEATVDAEPLLCPVLREVVRGWGVLGSRSLRVSFAMQAVRTCKCKFFSFVQTGIRTVPQNRLYQGHSGCTAVPVACVTGVCPPTPHSRVLKCRCFGGGGRGEIKTKKGEHSFSKTKKNAEGFELTSRELYNVPTKPLRHGASTT